MNPSRFAICLVLGVLTPVIGRASELAMPDRARLIGDRVSEMDGYALPVGPFDAGFVATRGFEGRIERQSWRLDGNGATTLQILSPLRDQITAMGYLIDFECRDSDCGGFDFRFAIEVIPAPDMHVNIRDFRYLAARKGQDEALSLLISRSGRTINIQTIHAAATGQEQVVTTPESDAGQTQGTGIKPVGLIAKLQAQGHVALSDLTFETGAARLGKGPFASLKQLAGYLSANPESRIALVGHTDSIGALDGNISLSKRRAGSVRARMLSEHGIKPDRIEAEGMGYLAPVASNLTARGREANRRVEAILLTGR